MSSTALRRTFMVLPAMALVVTAGTAALASPRKDLARPAQHHQQGPKVKHKPTRKPQRVEPQIGTAVTIVRNADGTITVVER